MIYADDDSFEYSVFAVHGLARGGPRCGGGQYPSGDEWRGDYGGSGPRACGDAEVGVHGRMFCGHLEGVLGHVLHIIIEKTL